MFKSNKNNAEGCTSLSDIPLSPEINDFGTESYVNGLIRFIERSSAPITIALQGEWGSGKTSLMNKLSDRLCGPGKGFEGISINTWEYSMLSTPEMAVINILEYLILSLTGGEKESQKVASNYMKEIKRGLLMSGHELLKTVTMGASAGLTNHWVEKSDEKGVEEKRITLSDLRKALESAIDKTVERGKRGVIVFVDDLDRLNPPLAVEILELLKNVFTLRNCIFVLAIDYDVVVKGLKPKFGELTDKNEREFRSFFDKIIQVPFSLPVNNYHPMDFVLNSLREIGYISSEQADDRDIKEKFGAVVESSVGKNPRSIKRLINTLSLLDCIAQCGGEREDGSTDSKLLNLLVVAIQICYPKIYRLLGKNPDFINWGRDFAVSMGIDLDEGEEGENEDEPGWEEILEAACQPDSYLTQHYREIKKLLFMILQICGENLESENAKVGEKLAKAMDKSSVTGISVGVEAEELTKETQKSIIGKLHEAVCKKVPEMIPNFHRDSIWPKRNTGKGGLYMIVNGKDSDIITFALKTNAKGQITLEMRINTHLPRPERLKGQTLEEILTGNPEINSAIDELDTTMIPLLSDEYGFYEGKTYQGDSSFYRSYRDELKRIHAEGWMSGDVTGKPLYWINLDKPQQFQDERVVDAVAKTVVATYKFRKWASGFR